MLHPLTPTEDMYLRALEDAPDGLSLEEFINLKVAQPRASNLVLTHIKNIRRKLPRGIEIETIRGYGYKLVKKSS